MNEATQQNKSVAQISRFIAVANFVLCKSKQTIKLIDLEGNLLGIAKRTEILDLLAGKRDHVNVVLYRE
jgi:hypothetical protein